MKIFKYILKIESTQEIYLPKEIKFLSVQMQYDILCVWARVDENSENVPYIFHIYGTGQDCCNSLKYFYLGTIQQSSFVWHIFVEFL